MSIQGYLDDITIDGSICLVTIIDSETEKISVCKAETRLFLNAIVDCYGENWKGKTIEYDLDSIGCMTSFQPMDLDDTF